MKILIDICHPAHVHFFYNPIRLLIQEGHEILITSRDKEVTINLLDALGLPHTTLSTASNGGIKGLAFEMIERNYALYKTVKRFNPDILTAIGGIFIAQIGWLTKTKSIVFYDTENAKLQNALTYPFTDLVVVPNCYQSWTPKSHLRYSGYHELSYLHPDYFTPDRAIAHSNGLAEECDTFLIRVVNWQANHDIGETGWSPIILEEIIETLAKKGKVIVSSESKLPKKLQEYSYSGDPLHLHHVLAFCRLYVGESATIASESVSLGVPAIYAAQTGRGYCDEQEQKYGLLKNIRQINTSTIEKSINEMLELSQEDLHKRHQKLLNETTDMPKFIINLLLSQ